MSTIKRIALASAIGVSLLSSTAFAAVPTAMQASANKEGKIIRYQVDNKNVALKCREATFRVAAAAKRGSGKLKGAQLRSAIIEATSVTAKKYNLADRCMTPVYISNAASKATGIYSAKGPTLGLAKLGAAGGAASAAAGGIGLGTIALGAAGLIGIAAIASDSDDKPASGTSATN